VESVPGVRPADLLAAELDADVRAAFAARLPPGRDHVCLPVHPFQWDEVVRPFFAPLLADGRMIELGTGPTAIGRCSRSARSRTWTARTAPTSRSR
jgi:siderophore synthetase component